jgi:hypothetical protein
MTAITIEVVDRLAAAAKAVRRLRTLRCRC